MREHYAPFLIGRRFRILPPDEHPEADERINLIMDRGAFGSGEHETTRSCLQLLEELPDLTGARLLDLGSGTGILSIAALLLGAETACCVDIDPAAVTACQRNCERNGIANQVTHLCAPLEQLSESRFDLILANIYGDILLDVAEKLVEKTHSGTHLLLSGILWEYNFDVRQCYRKLGCTVLKNQILEEFSTVLLRKE